MRGEVRGLRTPYPLARLVPAFMQEDELLVRLTTGLDDVLAPAVSVLDCLDAYVDPLLAPPDFVDWLAEWVGAPLDDHWAEDRRRWSVLASAALHRMRGTVAGVRAQVELATGGDVLVDDAANVTWSQDPTGDEGQTVPPTMRVLVAVDDPATVRLSVLEELVLAAKPAHLPHTIEVVQR